MSGKKTLKVKILNTLTKREIIEELGKHYQDFLAECDAYDGASFWSNKRVSELAERLILKSELKKKVEGMKKTVATTGGTGIENNAYNQALSDIINLLKEV
jgi:hypothetical protein